MSAPSPEQTAELKRLQSEFVAFAQKLGYYVSIKLRHSDTHYPNGDKK